MHWSSAGEPSFEREHSYDTLYGQKYWDTHHLTVIGVIKVEAFRNTPTQLRSGRPCKVTKWNSQVLKQHVPEALQTQ